MRKEGRPLHDVVGQDMRERFERDLERAREMHAERKREVADKLTREHKILCIESEPVGLAGTEGFQQMHEEEQTLYHETHTGGTGEVLYSPTFRYALGYEQKDSEGKFAVWNPVAGEEKPPIAMEEIDGLLLTGSRMMVSEMREKPKSEDAAWMRKIVAFLGELKRYELESGQTVPTLCVCFGHQIYATHEGGEVDWMTDEEGNRFRELGAVQVHLTDEGKQDPLLAGLPDEYFWVQSSHSQAVVKKPREAIVLAHNPVSDVQMVRYGKGMKYAIQNHPEFAAVAAHIARTVRAEAIERELAGLSDEQKEKIGFGSLDEIDERLVAHDTSPIRDVMMRNFIEMIAEKQKKK